MSYISDLIACPDRQEQLNVFFGCDKATMLKTNESSLAQFLMSPINTNNLLKTAVAPGGGKLRTVEAVFTPRIKSDDVSTSINRESCVASTPQGNRSESYTLDPDQGVQIERKIRMADLAAICKENEAYITEMLMMMMDAAIRKMDVQLASQIVLLSGNFGQGETGVDGNDAKIVATLLSNGGLNSDFISEIDFASENAGYCYRPFVFGWGDIYKAYTKLAASCCADNGLNVAALASSVGLQGSFIPNRNVKTSLGSDADFITLDPGAVQLLTYNGFEGYGNSVSDQTFVQTTIVHPQTGLTFDYQAKFDCGYWHFFVSLAFKAVGVPTDLYFSGDIYDGVTGVNKYKIVNPS